MAEGNLYSEPPKIETMAQFTDFFRGASKGYIQSNEMEEYVPTRKVEDEHCNRRGDSKNFPAAIEVHYNAFFMHIL